MEGERCWLSANQLNSARYSNYPIELNEVEIINVVLRLFDRRLVLRQCVMMVRFVISENSLGNFTNYQI